jgi:hypothetical protein
MQPRLRLTLPHLPTHCSGFFLLRNLSIGIALHSYWPDPGEPPKPHFNLGVFPLTKLLSSLSRITHSVESSELPLVRNYGLCPISFNNRLAFHSKPNVFSPESRLFDLGELKHSPTLDVGSLRAGIAHPFPESDGRVRPGRNVRLRGSLSLPCDAPAAPPFSLHRACAVPALRSHRPRGSTGLRLR